MRVESQERRVESQQRWFTLRFDSAHSQSPAPSPQPRGLTLIELLVVIVILVTLVAAAIPILAPANDDRRLREASRGVNTFIAGAAMKSIAIQRPVGVSLKRLSKETGRSKKGELDNDNGVCVEMQYVEQPSPFVGFDENSAARLANYEPSNSTYYRGIRPLVLIQFLTRGNTTPMSSDGLPVGWDADSFPAGIVRPGDVIEINGTQYELLADNEPGIATRLDPETKTFFASDTGRVSVGKASQIVAHPINNTGQTFTPSHDDRGNELRTPGIDYHAPFFTDASPYKILRQPAPSSTPPYQLPEGTAIDLRASSIGSGDPDDMPGKFFYVPNETDNDQAVVIMFAPEGRISRVIFDQSPLGSDEAPTFDQTVIDNVFLLVGKRENAPPPAVAADASLASSKLPTVGVAGREQKLQELKKPVNWLRGDNRWIVIGAQSGRVVTVENAFVDPAAVISKYTVAPYSLSQSSEELRNAQIFTSRGATKEMKQLGGR